jgi:penicillin-binding protein-related factor A (putative recombinase)
MEKNKGGFTFTFKKRATTREGRYFQSKEFKKWAKKVGEQGAKILKRINMSEQKQSTDEVKSDLINLLNVIPSVSLAQNQTLCELLYGLRKKYNVPTHEKDRNK